MITIEIDDNTPAGTRIFDSNGQMQPYILDIIINGEDTSDVMLVAKVAVYYPDGIKTAQTLKAHGFQVLAVDHAQLDADGNPHEYMF